MGDQVRQSPFIERKGQKKMKVYFTKGRYIVTDGGTGKGELAKGNMGGWVEMGIEERKDFTRIFLKTNKTQLKINLQLCVFGV